MVKMFVYLDLWFYVQVTKPVMLSIYMDSSVQRCHQKVVEIAPAPHHARDVYKVFNKLLFYVQVTKLAMLSIYMREIALSRDAIRKWWR